VMQEGGAGADSFLGVTSSAMTGRKRNVTACSSVKKMRSPAGGRIGCLVQAGEAFAVFGHAKRCAAHRAG